MAGKSLSGFKPYLQPEATPGAGGEDAMLLVDGLRMVRPSHGGSAEPFRGGTGKTATGVLLSDDWTLWSLEPASCFRALPVVAASRLGNIVTTQPAAVPSPTVYQHVLRLNPDELDDFITYNTIWGDGTTNFRSKYTAFQSLGFTAARGSVTVSSNAVGREMETSGITLPATGVTNLAMKPIQPNKAYIYIDDNWADIGTTQYLACYNFDIQAPDKYDLDAPINGAIVSFASLPEKEDQAITLNLSVAVDTAGLALKTKYKEGDMISLRYKIEGPIVEDAFKFTCQWDLVAYITQPGEVTSAPNSNIATFPIACEIANDQGDAIELTIINDVETYEAA